MPVLAEHRSRVGNLRHVRAHPRFFQFAFKTPAHRRVLVVVLDHRAAFLERSRRTVFVELGGQLKTRRMDSAAVAQRDVPRWMGRCIEVLMKPSARRAINTGLFPFQLDDFFSSYGSRPRSLAT